MVDIDAKEGESFDLYDAQGASMEVSGTFFVFIIPERCKIPRRLKCLVTPSLEEEEIQL